MAEADQKTLSATEAVKRLPKDAAVRVPEVDRKTGDPAFDVDKETKVRRYRTQVVKVGPEHVLKIADGYVVTVDGQKIRFAA